MDPFIIGIRFQKVGKIYHFDATKSRDFQLGDFVIVETSRGSQLGEVVQIVENPILPPEGNWKPIHHKATPRDLVLRQSWQQKEEEAVDNCRAKLIELGIPGVKIVTAEYSFDGTRLSILYSTEADEKVDLHKMHNAIKRIYPRTRVELRQVGPRDVAKFLGGMGACGMENRCCSKFLCEFSPISIKMAKEQGVSLTPSEITGMCGRLRCCLIYEYDQYIEARRNLPKRGNNVTTPLGKGTVVDYYPIKQSFIVDLDTGKRTEVAQDQVKPVGEFIDAQEVKDDSPNLCVTLESITEEVEKSKDQEEKIIQKTPIHSRKRTSKKFRRRRIHG